MHEKKEEIQERRKHYCYETANHLNILRIIIEGERVTNELKPHWNWVSGEESMCESLTVEKAKKMEMWRYGISDCVLLKWMEIWNQLNFRVSTFKENSSASIWGFDLGDGGEFALPTHWSQYQLIMLVINLWAGYLGLT